MVLLDEPTRGLDYEAKRALARIIGELREQGHAIVLASHDIEFVAQVATKVAVLEKARIKAQASPLERAAAADYILNSNQPLPGLLADATALWNKFLLMAQEKAK